MTSACRERWVVDIRFHHVHVVHCFELAVEDLTVRSRLMHGLVLVLWPLVFLLKIVSQLRLELRDLDDVVVALLGLLQVLYLFPLLNPLLLYLLKLVFQLLHLPILHLF